MIKKIRSGGILIALLALFLSMFAVFGPGVYNDSDQYLKMHIHREPLYPLFLALLRMVFGEGWLTAMGILQNVLAAVSIWLFADYLAKWFSLRFFEEMVVVVLGLMPHMITKYYSALHLFMTNSVMSEAICLPVFTLFLLACFQVLTEEEKGKKNRAALVSLLLAFLLSLTRSQMMLTFLLWGIVVCARLLADGKKESKKRRLFCLMAVVFIVAASFFARTIVVKSYNYLFNGRFINNTYGTVNTLTNILYAADREDGERIRDEEARSFFYRMYDLTEERQANYRYAGNSWHEKVEHIEMWHDTVKYEMIEDVFYQTYDKEVTSDYITQNLMADETAGKIIAGIWPGCFRQWFINYLLIASYGLIRSIGVVHPLLNPVTLLLYLSAIVMGIWNIRRSYKANERISKSAWLMGLSLLAVLANVFAVSITIMALSRYMIYGFSIFYTAYFLLLREEVNIYR
ncbi:hypothetical protein [Kineothrix sp. MB12-C1]|uniref:hypothetical protein n=1 Tax=Kineothrix sp. MB12-C1 TaxID=3070215 RepID=UPI0027D32B39|nr:hypothetical protein [Kineothrix sp. MB12-C1]WMC91651.1 hypothetical protein RBB56_12350 [Kineothrix sp. MB12-C1]